MGEPSQPKGVVTISNDYWSAYHTKPSGKELARIMTNQQKIQHTSVYLQEEIHTKLRVACVHEKATMSDLIMRALEGKWCFTPESAHGLRQNSGGTQQCDRQV